MLGEEIRSEEEAAAITRAYVDLLDAIVADGLDANVSVKLTGLGLKLDTALARENLETAIAAAATASSGSTWRTRRRPTARSPLPRARRGGARATSASSSRLRSGAPRTTRLARRGERAALQRDLHRAAESSYSATSTRSVPASSRTLDVLLDGGCYVGIATHDEWLVDQALEAIRERGLGPDAYEFQMLLGVRPELGDRIVADGHRLRIYVPFGRQWYEYSLRRLQENPKIAGYVAGDLLGSLVRRR